MSVKGHRRAAIARLLQQERHVGNQEQLRELLESQGIDAGQATLSRDLRELGVVKGPLGYVLPGSETMLPRGTGRELDHAVREALLSAEPAGNLAVLKTGPGRAQMLAVELDRTPPEGVVGVLAGDDTIFLACRSASDAETIIRQFRQTAGLPSLR